MNKSSKFKGPAFVRRSRTTAGRQNSKINLGFTLMELLVVISIIAILISVGMSSYSTAQKKGRDAKRKSDLRDIANSLEQYYSVCGYQYPTPGGTFYSSIVCVNPTLAIMPTVPSDPKGATPYSCPTPKCTASGYMICTQLESQTPANYCLTNQQ